MKKRTILLTNDILTRVASSGSFKQLQCCGLAEFSGLGEVNSVEAAVAIRRLAYGDVDYYDDVELTEFQGNRCTIFDGTRGVVLVTTIPSQRETYKWLKQAGFTRIHKFKNGNTGNTVTVWSAPTIKPGVSVIRGGQATELVKF